MKAWVKSVQSGARKSIGLPLTLVVMADESKYQFDYYHLLATIPGEEAFKPMEEGGCPLLKQA